MSKLVATELWSETTSHENSYGDPTRMVLDMQCTAAKKIHSKSV